MRTPTSHRLQIKKNIFSVYHRFDFRNMFNLFSFKKTIAADILQRKKRKSKINQRFFGKTPKKHQVCNIFFIHVNILIFFLGGGCFLTGCLVCCWFACVLLLYCCCFVLRFCYGIVTAGLCSRSLCQQRFEFTDAP